MGLEAVTYINDLVTTNPLSSDPRSEGDDHFRNVKTALKNTFPGMAGRAFRIQTKGAGYTAVATDNMSLIDASAAFTLALTAAATLGNGWMVYIDARAGNVVVDPDGGEVVNGVASVTIPVGTMGVLFCTGTEFKLAILELNGTTLSPSTLGANQNDYAPTGLAGAKVLRLAASGRINITGLTGGIVNRILTVHNVGEYPIDFTYEDGASTAANRFAFGYGLGGGQTMVLIYDGTSSRWRAQSLPEARVGAVLDHAGGTIPPGFLGCDGAAVSRTTYVALFREIGTTWGVGDGSTTFNVPDFRRRTTVGSGGTGTAQLGNSVGNTGGAESRTIATANLPASGLSIPSLSVSGSVNAFTARLTNGGGGGTTNIQAPTPQVPLVNTINDAGTLDYLSPLSSNSITGSTGTGTTGNMGSGTALDEMQPSGVVLKIIKF